METKEELKEREENGLISEEETDKEFQELLESLDKGGITSQIKRDLEDYNTKEEAIGYLKDVCSYGGVSGTISGLIYYKDTIAFYDENEDEIEQILEDYRENCGYKNRMEAIANLSGSDNIGNIDQEKNLLSWMAYEEVARRILIENFKVDY